MNSPANVGDIIDTGLIPGSGTSGRKHGTHSNILAWRIQWTEEPSRLQSTGSQRVRHNWSDLIHISIGRIIQVRALTLRLHKFQIKSVSAFFCIGSLFTSSSQTFEAAFLVLLLPIQPLPLYWFFPINWNSHFFSLSKQDNSKLNKNKNPTTKTNSKSKKYKWNSKKGSHLSGPLFQICFSQFSDFFFF